MLQIISRTVGLLSANCHVLRTDEEVIVIDPGGNAEVIYPLIGPRMLKYIINTHGHYDHIAANNDLKARFDTRILIGEHDADMLLDPELNLSAMVDRPYISMAPDALLKDGDRVPFAGKYLEVMLTPGHTKGSICLLLDNKVFSGDTLFFHSVGRTDLPTGSFSELERSIRSRLYTLPDDTKVYTGHGENTLIGEEKKYNEFVKP